MRRPDLRWPLVLPLWPSGLDLLDRADHVFDHERRIAAPCDDVMRALFDDALVGAHPVLLGFRWHTPPGRLEGARVDEAFVFLSLRLRTVAYEPGRRLALSVDRCSLPLGREMLEVIDTVPDGDGCRLRFRVAVRFLPGARPLAPVVLPAFRRLFDVTLDAVARSVAHPEERGRA